MNGYHGPPTAAKVVIVTNTNVTWEVSWHFDPPGPTGCMPSWCYGGTGTDWSLDGMNFRMDIKGNRGMTGALLSIVGPTGGSNAFQIQDANNRIVSSSVPDTVLSGAASMVGVTGQGLIPGNYVYDFIMYDGASPPNRIMLMYGPFILNLGITGN